MRQRRAVERQDLIAAAQADPSAGLLGLDREHERLRRQDAGLVVAPAGGVEHGDRDDDRRARLLDLDVRERHRRVAAAHVVEAQRRRPGALDRPRELGPRRDRNAVDRGDEVERLEAGLRRRRRRIEHADLGQVKARRHADPAERAPCGATVRTARSRSGVTSRSSASGPRRIAKRSVLPAESEMIRAPALPSSGRGCPSTRLDAVAGQQARVRGGQVGQHRPDRRRQHRALAGEVNEVDEQRQQQVEHRPGDDDRVALPQRLRGQRARPIDGRDRLARILAQQAHVAAERDRRQPVLGLAPGEAEDARAEPEREAQHLDVEQLREHEVPELVHQDQHAQQHHDGRRGPEHAHAGRAS